MLDCKETSSSEMSPAPELGQNDCIFRVFSFSVLYALNIHITRIWFHSIRKLNPPVVKLDLTLLDNELHFRELHC